ncbi:MAG: hypothetical protein M0R46_04555 [Candidatus Muirbacterium halophilum]|nr:hypothetical protein [Candidatus Muirbacterium halophilum]
MKKLIVFLTIFVIFINSYCDLDRIVSKEYFGYNLVKKINSAYKIEDAISVFENSDELTRRSFASLVSIYLNQIEKMYNNDGYVGIELEYLVALERMILDFTDEIETIFADNINGLSKKVTLLEVIINEKSRMKGVSKFDVSYDFSEPVNDIENRDYFIKEKKDDYNPENIDEKVEKFVSNLELKAAQENIAKSQLDKVEFHPDFYKLVSVNAVGTPLKSVMDAIIENTSINLFISKESISNLTLQIKNMSLIDALRKISDLSDTIYEIENNNLNIRSKFEIEEKVIRLKFLEAEKALEFLNKIKTPKGKIITNNINNSLIVYDTAENVKKMQASILEIDRKDASNTFMTKVIPLNYAEAVDIISVSNTLKSPEGNISANIKSNSIIVMDKRKNIESIEELVKKIDIPSFESRKTTFIYNVKYSSAGDILTILQSEAFSGSVSKDVKLASDDRTNSIVMTGSKETINKILQYVGQLDIRTKQVTIEAKIIEVKLDDENTNGVNFATLLPTGAKDKTMDEENKLNISMIPNDSVGGNATSFKFGTLAKEQLAILYQNLTTKTNGKVVSSPTITTLDNQEAKILIGEKIPFEETTSSEGNTSSTINFKDVGITLTVTPKISPDNYVTLKVHPEISSSTKTTANGEPIIETTEADTNVIIKNGETLVIGGLIKNNKRTTVNRVPFLGRIGFLRKIFKYEKIANERTETIVLITPNIIEDYNRNNNVYMKKYKTITRTEAIDD